MKTLFLFTLLLSCTALSQSLTIATWNIEHLGSGGRGFPEYGQNGFDARTQSDFEKIGTLIENELSLEIVCAQEISSSSKKDGKSYSDELAAITKSMGDEWRYYLAIYSEDDAHEDEMQNAFIYNSDKVLLKKVFELPVPDMHIGEKKAFDRKPLIGYFESVDNSDGFVLVNVHLASGQQNDENHMASMIIIEQSFKYAFKKYGVDKKEKDIIILGDFNDNPWNLKRNGECCATSDLMYKYMEEKGYTNLVNKSFRSTRMNKKFSSIIDHVLVSKSAKKHIEADEANIYFPADTSKKGLKAWRKVYSDHFPVYFEYEVKG